MKYTILCFFLLSDIYFLFFFIIYLFIYQLKIINMIDCAYIRDVFCLSSNRIGK